MSLAKITRVQRARKPGTCRKCNDPINIGDSYIHFTVGFRGFKQSRCAKQTCFPSNGERESSKIAGIYFAMDSFESNIDAAETVEELEEFLEEFASVIEEIAEEYREASVNPETGVTFNLDSEERADILDGSADEVRSISISGDMIPCDVCEGVSDEEVERAGCEACGGEREIVDMDAARDEARAAVEVELP